MNSPLRRRGGRVAAILGLALGLALAAANPAAIAGHALLQSSEPAAGSTVGASPGTVTLVFGERPDPRLSTIKVLDRSGANHATGSVALVDGQPTALRVAVEPVPDGVYTVAWRSLSAVDGHSAIGSFSFGVGVPVPAAAPAPATPSGLAAASPAAAVARLLLYAGLIAMFGAGIAGWLVVPSRAERLRRLAIAAWLLSTAGAAGVVAVQWSAAEADVAAIAGTSLGLAGIARLLAAALAGAAVARAARPSARPGAAVALAAGLAMAVDVVAGHAAAVEPAVLQLAFQWLHVAAVGFWIGGLAALLLAIRDAPPDERAAGARRFSLLAGFAIAIVAVTGVLRAIAEVGTLDALLATDYGTLVVVKSGLIVALAALGATNHFWSVPAAVRTFVRIRRVGTIELSVAMAVIALSSLLVDLAPPVSAGATAPPPAPPIVATGSDFGTSVRLRLVVSPGSAGSNTFSAAVTDFDTNAPVDTASLSLRLHLASQAGVGDATLTLPRTGPGTFEAQATSLSIDGIWQVTATVAGPSGTVEVGLVVSTQVPAEAVELNATPGVPTIYLVHLGNGGTLQVYLDPETAGSAELHATFFDAAGHELAVPSVTMAVAPVGGAGELLQPRQLEPGHFVADLETTAGELPVDVVGPDPVSGQPIHVHLSVSVQP
jgi:copper transport protein